MIKVILAVLILFGCNSMGYAVDFDQGDTWVSNRYEKPGAGYRQGDRTIKTKNLDFFGRDYIFQKSGRNLYKAYDDETGDFLEMKIRKNGWWEFYDYETGESWVVTKPAGREKQAIGFITGLYEHRVREKMREMKKIVPWIIAINFLLPFASWGGRRLWRNRPL